MTKEQATAVMVAGIPVKCYGMEFLKIIGVGDVLTDHNSIIARVTLRDRFKKTIYHANPADVTMHGEVDGVMYYLDGATVRAVRDVGVTGC